MLPFDFVDLHIDWIRVCVFFCEVSISEAKLAVWLGCERFEGVSMGRSEGGWYPTESTCSSFGATCAPPPNATLAAPPAAFLTELPSGP